MDELEAAAAMLSCPHCKRVRRAIVYPTLRPPTEHWIKCTACNQTYPQSEAREVPHMGEDGRPVWTLPRRLGQ